MSGRGNLLSLFKKTGASAASTSSGEQAKDSGLDGDLSLSSLEAGQENIPHELAADLQNIKISKGRGRARLLESFKSSTQLGNVASVGASSLVVQEKPKEAIHHKPTISSSGLYFPEKVYGSTGAPVNLTCNYINLQSDPNKGVYLYEVRFNPAVDSKQLRNHYLNEHKDKFGGTKTFDGVNLYLPIMLDKELTTYVSNSKEGTKIEVRILFKKKESLKNCLPLYNILFDRVMNSLKYVRFDRKQYDPSCPKVIPIAKLEVWPGYVTAVDEFDGGLMLCCDVSHRLLCQKTVLEMLIELYHQNKSNYQDQAKKCLIGNIVLTRYNNRTYKIDDICFTQNPSSTFETHTGSINYTDYYKNHHNITIKDIKQPLLLSMKKARGADGASANDLKFCLIPELCYLTGLRDEMREDKKLMREIATYTRVSPNQRMLALEKFFDSVTKSPDAKAILASWGLTLMKNFNVQGRKMSPEQIYFANKDVSAGYKADFNNDALSSEMLDVVHLNTWILIHHKNDFRAAQTLLENMKRCCQALGMKIASPRIISLDQDRVDLYVDALRRNIDMNCQLVVCITPNMREDRYSAIKKICCSELPVASQVINARTLANESKNRSIVQKIILQVNCKMGGSLWTVKIPFKSVMVCGIDSYHDPSQKKNSVAAFVASLNNTYTNWYSKAIIQTKREEIVGGLTAAFEAALACYKARNGNLPDSVIIYRDGVGDGQLALCSNYEVPQFEAACKGKVRITFIVVQKRINTRFFTGSMKNFDNPQPGTVIDQRITRSHMYDFFLVSQQLLVCTLIS
ncbi:AGO3 [Drosophila busckii]|uniref:AGO3 n=1 Tax=Drosophila busckii TaxID=30019 RepID=A0A0M5IYT6_DROBS|nr:AGO3 [Drosophila busckii]